MDQSETVHAHIATTILIGVRCHWWFNYPGPLLEVELESACLSGQVRPPLYSFDSTQPLSCLGSSVVRASAQQAVCRGFESHPSSFFLFGEKRAVGLVALPFFYL